MRAIIYGGLRYVQQSGYRLGTIAQIGNGCGNGCVIYLIFLSFFFCRKRLTLRQKITKNLKEI